MKKIDLDLGNVLDALPAMVWTALPDGQVDFLNRRWLEYTGIGCDGDHGRAWRAVISANDLPLLRQRWDAILASGEAGDMHGRVRRSDGQYRWFRLQVSPMRDAAGRVLRWWGVGWDVDDQHRADDTSRRRSELDFQSIVDSIPVPVAVTTPSGEIEGLNQRTLDYFGKTFEELKNWKSSDVVHPDDLQQTVIAQAQAHENGTAYNVESRHRRADGAYRWYNVRGFPLRDREGGIQRWFHMLIDIDARKRAEVDLRRSEAFLAEGQHLARMGNFSWHLATGDIVWSEQLYRIFEFETHTRVTLDLIATRVHPEDLWLMGNMIERARNGEAHFEYQHRLLMSDQSIKYIHLIAHRAMDHPGLVEYIGAAIDVTQRQLAEDALGKARSELAHATRIMSLGALTASIAHEVNQPLSGIITNAGTCLRMLAAEPPNIEGAMETARRTIRDGNRASEVIARLRALFSKRSITLEGVDLNDAAREVLALVRSELERGRVLLRTEFAETLPPVEGDRIQIQQVVMNLIRNAVDAMRTLDDRPRSLLIKTQADTEAMVRLAVQDAGIGFDPHDSERLFEAFYTTKGDGMGIGLSVCRSIIESHRGRLWAVLNDGPGATFAFTIPRYMGWGEAARGIGYVREFHSG